MVVDFQCTKCGASEQDVIIKNHEEIVTCKICEEPMQRIFSGTVYKTRPSSGTPVPPHLLGGGERANFGRLE